MKILAALFTFVCLPSFATAGEEASIAQDSNKNEKQDSRRLGYTSTQAPVGYTSTQAPVGYTSTQAPVGYTSTQAPVGYTQAPRLPTIEKWISRRTRFATLYNLLEIASLAPNGPLATSSSLTLFAPDEAAFEYTFDKYPGSDLALLDDVDALTSVLSYHALVGEILSGDIPVGTTKFKMLNGEWLRIIKTCTDIYKATETCTVQLKDGTDDLATVTSADNKARNGVIHVINKVLIPPSLADFVEGLIPVHTGGGHYDTYYGY
jgi:uncharacterized surface protein with fasciclin (FAS1) repeats